MKKICLLLSLFAYSFVSYSQAIYTWNAPSGTWSNPGNWTPFRSPTLSTDVLVFDGSFVAAPTAYLDAGTANIGQLKFINGVSATLAAASGGNQTVNIDNGIAGTDLIVNTGCTATFTNVTNGDEVYINITSGETGQVDGTVVFDGTSGGLFSAHQFTAADASALIFSNGSSITYQGRVSGNLFGNSGTQNTVIFQAGSKYISKAGSNPFGFAAPSSKVVFQKGSLFSYQQTSLVALAGRTYANFEIDEPTFNQSLTGGSPLRVDTFTIKNVAAANFNLTGGIVISGNMTIQNGAVSFNPSSTGTIMFDGDVQQAVSGTFSFPANVKMVVARSSTVTLQSDITTPADSVSIYGKLYTNTQTVAGGTFYLPPENFATSFFGNSAAGSNTITVTSTGGVLRAGMEITGVGIPANTYIMKIAGNVVHLSRFATSGGAGFNFFVSTSRGTLGIGNANGITTAPTLAGNVQSNTRIFGTEANYEYTGTTAQVTGNGLPASIKNLILNKTMNDAIVLSAAVSIDDTLSLQRGILFTSAGTQLNLRDTTALTSPSSNYSNLSNLGWEKSFIAGPLRAEIRSNTNKWFPVGKISGTDTLFAPAAVKTTYVGPVNDTVEYFPTQYIDTASDRGQLHHISSVEYWAIGSDVTGSNSNAKITLSWRPKSLVGDMIPANDATALNDLVATHYLDDDGTIGPNPFLWHIEGSDLAVMAKNTGATVNYGTVTTNVDNSPVTTSSSTHFFTLGTRSLFNDLPLKLLDFSATVQQKNIAVKWITREEQNIDRFEVEAGIDGRNFRMIGSISSANSTSVYIYNLLDFNPSEGWNYYRLKISDQQGHISYSPVIKAWMGITARILVYPNPAEKEIKIILPPQSSTTEISIVNSAGQVVRKVRCYQSSLTMNIESLNSGSYFIYIHNNRQAIVQRFTKL